MRVNVPGKVANEYILYICTQTWKLHISGVTTLCLYSDDGFQDQTSEVFEGLKDEENCVLKKGGVSVRVYGRVQASTCSASLHGQPYPTPPQNLLHVQQVHSQHGFQLLARSLWAPAVRAVHGHAQAWHQQEEAGEEGEVGAGRWRLIGCRRKTQSTFGL